MTDSALNYYLASGTHAARLAFAPSPPTPAAGPSNLYLWFETDTSNTYAYHGGTWTQVNTGSGGGGPSYSVPDPTTFTWMNQGTSTAQQAVSGASVQMSLSPVNSTQNWRGLFTNVPGSTPYKVKAQLSAILAGGGAAIAGLYFTDGTKLYGIELLSTGGTPGLRIEKINNTGSDNSTAATFTGSFIPVAGFWLQLRNDGTKLYFDYSFDGEHFLNLWSENIGTWLTPVKYGYGGFAQNGTAQSFMWWLNWATAANANLNW